MEMTYNEKIELIKGLYDNYQLDDAWRFFKETVLDYVTGSSWYRETAKTVEETSHGEVSTFLFYERALVSHEHTRSLFETWINEYHDTYDKHKNSFSSPFSKSKDRDGTKKILITKDYFHIVYDWLNDHPIYHDYLWDQLVLRGVGISMGHTTTRRTVAIIDYTLTGHGGGIRWRTFTQDIGIRIATDPIIIEVINQL